MDALVITIPAHCKDELEQLMKGNTPIENEGMLRIGMQGIQMLRKGMFQGSDDDVRRTYEEKLAQKDHDRAVWEQIFVQHQGKVVDERMGQLQAEKERWEERWNEVREKCRNVTNECDRIRQMQDIEIQQQVTIEANKWKHIEQEVVRTKESMEMKEKMMELEWNQRLNEANEMGRNLRDVREKQLLTDLEASRAHSLELEVKYLQRVDQERKKCDEELNRVRDQLHMATSTIETIKVDTLTAAMEEQRLQFEEIKKELKVNHKSSAGLGKIGEEYFRELAERTFATYDDFELEDKTKVGHAGDFHLKFKQFSVLVDTKNFDVSRISTIDVAKFRRDMTRNPSIRVGWLVSLNGHISKYSKQPYVFEVDDGQLLVFVNNLRNVENPGKMLEDLYYMSSFLCEQMVNSESNTQVLSDCKKFEKRVKENVEKLIKLCKKTKMTMVQMQGDVAEVERAIHDILNENVLEIQEEHAAVVKQWWTESMMETTGGKVKSNALYEHFVQVKGPTSINTDMFKSLLKEMLPADRVQLPKIDKSQYAVLGYKFKE